MDELDNLELSHAKLVEPQFNKMTDVTIHFKEATIYSFRCILEKRAPQFFTSEIVKKKKERKTGQMTVDIKPNTVSPAIFQQILVFVYTGSVPFEKLTYKEVLEIQAAAMKVGIPALSKSAERYLQSALDTKTIFLILKTAHETNNKALKDTCIDFALLDENYPLIVGSKDGIHELGLDLFQELTLAPSQGRTGKPITFVDVPKNTVREDFKQILSTCAFPDAKATFADGEVPFHKAILAAHSDKLLEKIQREKSPYKFDKLTADSFRGLLELVYYGASGMEPKSACKLIEHFVVPFNTPSVRSYCEKVLQRLELATIFQVLAITYLPINENRKNLVEDLRSNCLQFIVQHFSELKITGLRFMESNIIYDVLEQVHASAKNGGTNVSSSSSSSSSSSKPSSARKPAPAPAPAPPPRTNSSTPLTAPPPAPITDSKKKGSKGGFKRWKSGTDLKKKMKQKE